MQQKGKLKMVATLIEAFAFDRIVLGIRRVMNLRGVCGLM